MNTESEIKQVVRERYASAAVSGTPCCGPKSCGDAADLGLDEVFAEPSSSPIRPGQVVRPAVVAAGREQHRHRKHREKSAHPPHPCHGAPSFWNDSRMRA